MQVSPSKVTLMLLAWKRLGDNLDLEKLLTSRWLRIALWFIVAALSAAKFLYLSADFPNWSLWMIDQAKFTDEGWWASAAVAHALTAHWYVAGDYNPAVALPVWPALLGVVFHFTGVSVIAARAFNVAISIATLGVVFVLVRRYTATKSETPALLAVLLLAASPFAFVFNRLAILETLVVFEFCLLLLVASFASAKRFWPLAALSVLTTAMLLTKTTSALLVPAVVWVAWSAMDLKPAGLWRSILAVAVLPFALVKGYAALVAALGYGADYQYFFGVNAMPDIDWHQTIATLSGLFQNCIWVDRVLYPVSLLILLLAVAWKRKLWGNSLFTASWIAVAAQAAFIFMRQEDFAPRYFLVMLAPIIWIVTLTFGELTSDTKKTAILLLVLMAASAGSNVVTIRQFLTDRDYDFRDAALSIRAIVRSHPQQRPLILGASGAQVSLMTGIPSIDDGYGTEDIAKKVARLQPGWYLAWNDLNLENEPFLSPFRLEKMASYAAFDDDTRTTLTLYKLVPREY